MYTRTRECSCCTRAGTLPHLRKTVIRITVPAACDYDDQPLERYVLMIVHAYILCVWQLEDEHAL